MELGSRLRNCRPITSQSLEAEHQNDNVEPVIHRGETMRADFKHEAACVLL